MKHGWKIVAGIGAATVALTMAAPGTAGAAIRNVDGQMGGPGGFRTATCDGGVINIEGHGAFAGKQLGLGTYTYAVCFTTTATGNDFAGTARFTMRSGAKLRGTITGSTTGGPPPSYPFTVTSGTKRFRHATGTLQLGPFTETNETNCDHQICVDWTDTGPITGTLRHVILP